MQINRTYILTAFIAVVIAGWVWGHARHKMRDDALVVTCKASDFRLTDLTASRQYDMATVKGSIASTCKSPAIVQLRWIEHNPDGTISTFPFLAHDGLPIGPGESYLFAVSENVQTGAAARWQIVVDDVRHS